MKERKRKLYSRNAMRRKEIEHMIAYCEMHNDDISQAYLNYFRNNLESGTWGEQEAFKFNKHYIVVLPYCIESTVIVYE